MAGFGDEVTAERIDFLGDIADIELAADRGAHVIEAGAAVGQKRAVALLADRRAFLLVMFVGNIADDQDGVYAAVADRHPEAAVIVPPRTTAVPTATADTTPTQRDGHLRCIAEVGRMAWQTTSGYNKRAKVEAAIGRWKQVIGNGLRARRDDCRATEVDVAVHVLNHMLRLGRPSYVRIA